MLVSHQPRLPKQVSIFRDLWNNNVAVTGSFVRNFASVNEP
jgi:hypothetical protein